MNASLVVNPAAGGRAHRSINRIETLLREQVSLTTFITRKKGDAFSFAKAVKGADRIIVAGGDGTINEVINGLLSSDDETIKNVPLAIIPLGTANVLAAEVGIPRDLEKAAVLSINGTAKKIALGRMNGRYFSLMSGIGFDGETVFGVKNGLLKRLTGKGAYIAAGIRTLRKYPPALIRVKTSEGEFTGYTAVVSNVRCYGGDFHIAPRASVTEPLLDICIFRGKTRKDLLRFIYGVMRKEHLGYHDVVYVKSPAAEVSSEGEVHVQVDGDYYGMLPVKIEVVKDAVGLVW
ncbi:MAG: diacylglycerol kinase family lipid kinase [Nitrospirota bacterium]|nr:diacylglycerol kinase family lipid kinase [Nitrospirota bacterium]